MVVAMQWASRITTIGMETALPGALGYWLDQRWGTGPWLLSLGVILGFAVSLVQLMSLVKTFDKQDKEKSRQRDRKTPS
jgi:F0F1-type ATP synthase assembly protein I